MTVSTTTSRTSYAGNGSTVAFTVPFYFLADADLVVIKTSSAGIETTLVLNTDYTVAGAGVVAGGTVTCTTAPASGESLVIYRDPAATQLTDYQANDPFPAETHERALDKLTMIAQRVKDLTTRSFRLSDGDATTASTTLPSPQASNIVGWNEAATGLQNYDVGTFATVVSYGTARADLFSGNGSTTAFTLSANPGAQANLDVSISGVQQRPGLDYTWSSGTTITFTSAPPSGTNNILVRYMQGLAQGTSDSASASFIQSGTGAVTRTAQEKMRETISVKDFGAKGDGVTDDIAAITAAIDAAAVSCGTVYFPPGKYMVSAPIRVKDAVTLLGAGCYYASGPVYNGTTIWALPSFNYPTRGIIENYNAQLGTLQEFANIEKILVYGNRLGGAICGAGIRFDQIFINSYIRDVLVMECSGDGIQCTTPAFTGTGGPIELQNIWINGVYGHGLVISNSFQYVRVRNAAIERWGSNATSGTKHGIYFAGAAGRDLLRMTILDGIYFELAAGKNHHGIYCMDASCIDMRNITGGGGSGTETGTLIVMAQSAGGASYAFPISSNSHGITVSGLYNGTSFAKTIDDQVNGIVRTDVWIPRYAQAEPIVLIGATGAPAFTNSWVNRASGSQSAGYYIDEEGCVCLMGGIKSGTVGSSAFTLPAGARPTAGLEFAVMSNGALGRVDISSTGTVTPISPSNNTYVSLDGIRFKALA